MNAVFFVSGILFFGVGFFGPLNSQFFSGLGWFENVYRNWGGSPWRSEQ